MNQGLPKIDFKKKRLSNGLIVIVVPKYDTRLVAVNLLYRTGSRNENPDHTGLAHLMEHLMFSGTPAHPKFDLPVSRVGGYNNAFTTRDVTNYHVVVPAEHLAMALHLEADRMVHLKLDEEKVEAEKRVVLEEFRQNYLNQPYGDLYHHLFETAYAVHPYRWRIIGYSPDHLKEITAAEVREFYGNHYQPSNLILSIAGNVSAEEAISLVEDVFGKIPSTHHSPSLLPQEPVNGRKKKLVVHKNVPASALVVSFPTPAVNNPDYLAFNFLADILGSGIISRLHHRLVRQDPLFTRIAEWNTGTIDPGLFNIIGLLCDGLDADHAVLEIISVIRDFILQGPTKAELNAVVNGMLTSLLLRRQDVANLALEVAQAEMEDDCSSINDLYQKCSKVDAETLIRIARHYFVDDNRIEIHYLSEKKK